MYGIRLETIYANNLTRQFARHNSTDVSGRAVTPDTIKFESSDRHIIIVKIMSLKHLVKNITLLTFLAGTAGSISNVASAQSFYYPSASFFSPFAHGYESGDDAVDLATMLESEQFATFNSNLQKAELSDTIQQQSLTILAPTEEAFAALSPSLAQKLSDPETLKKVLQYHMILGNIDEEDIKRRGVATLLERNSVQITGIPAENEGMTVQLNDATASEPLAAANGVVIPIDKVLIPSGI